VQNSILTLQNSILSFIFKILPGEHSILYFQNTLLEYFVKAHVLVDAQHGGSGATGTPQKLGWNIGCEHELNYRVVQKK